MATGVAGPAVREPHSAGDRVPVLVDLAGTVLRRHLPAAIGDLAEAEPPAGRTPSGRHPDGANSDETTAERDVRLAESRLRLATTAGTALDWLDRTRPGEFADNPRHLSLLAERAAWRGRAPVAVTLAERVLAAGATRVDDAPAYLRAALVLADSGRLEDAHEHCDAIVAGAERSGQRLTLAVARSVRSTVARRLGRFVDALDDAGTGLELLTGQEPARQVGEVTESVMACLARLVHVLVETGGHGEAAGLLDNAVPVETLGGTWSGTALLFARGRLRAVAGQQVDAARDLRAAGERLACWGVDNPATVPWRSELAAALWEIGEREDAIRYAADEVELARGWGAPGPLGRALCVQARMVGGPGELAALREATALLERSADLPVLARCLTEYGAASRRAGHPVPARRLLHTALDLAQRCQSPVLAGRAREELAAAGGRRPKARLGDVAGLTRAERRTVTLAARGRTNREIAEALFVQRRTVEIHLTNAYRKLGIGGRDELAVVLERLGTRAD
jgi:DNA-binding CsgD family transcriptional regulator